jgi:signal transduction histidine kinase
MWGKNKGALRVHTMIFVTKMHPDDREMVDQHFRTSLNNDKEIDIICRFTNTDEKPCYVSIRGHLAGEGAERRFVGIMMDITEKRQIEEETARLKQDQQKNITRAILNAQENEQRRISDSLHDGVSQLLYGIKMQLETVPGNDKGLNDSRIAGYGHK